MYINPNICNVTAPVINVAGRFEDLPALLPHLNVTRLTYRNIIAIAVFGLFPWICSSFYAEIILNVAQ